LSGEPKNKERRRKKLFCLSEASFKVFSRQPVVLSSEADIVLIFCILFYQEKSMRETTTHFVLYVKKQ